MFDVTAQMIHNEEEIYCLDKIVHQKNSWTQLECNEAWKSRVAGARAERNYRDFEDVKGESAEFEWNIFQGFASLQFCNRISNFPSF